MANPMRRGRPLDMVSMRVATSTPEGTWVSYGLVSPSQPGSPAVTFDPDLGPLVSVLLQPANTPAICRVGGSFAGDGEAAYDPYIEGDEVVVLLPQGVATAGALIIGRMNGGVDKWPTSVAGQDATTNVFAFRRRKPPFIFETASTYLVRSATTKAFLSMDDTGGWSMACGDGHYIAATSDFVTLQSVDNSLIVQLDLNDNRVLLQAGATLIELHADADANWFVAGTLSIGTTGGFPTGHAASLEQIMGVLGVLASAIPGGGPALVAAAIAGASAAPLDPSIVAAIQTALEVPRDPTGVKPGVGLPGFLIG